MFRIGAFTLRRILGGCFWRPIALAALPCLWLQPAWGQDARDCPPAPQPPTSAELQAAHANARDRGMLFSLDKDGRRSYLFGTVHVGSLPLAVPGPRLRAAMEATQVLALEIDIGAPGFGAEFMRAQAQRPRFELSADQQRRLDARIDAECLPRDVLAALHPLLQISTLTSMAGRRDGYDVAYAQELVLSGFVRARGRQIVALETVERQLQALLPDDPQTARRGFDEGLSWLEDGRARALLRRTVDAWADGDLQRIGSLEHLCDCEPTADERAELMRLNDERNPGLARRIAELHAEGRPLLAAVGALHLTGPLALPELLREQGFTVQRLRD